MEEKPQRGVGGPAEITYFESIEAVENVLGFDVSVDDIVAVQVSNSIADLPEVRGGFFLWEAALLPDLSIQASTGGDLKQ